MTKVCDARNDCPNNEDEPVNCFIDECLSRNGHCMHDCVDLKIGYECSCHRGMRTIIKYELLLFLHNTKL